VFERLGIGSPRVFVYYYYDRFSISFSARNDGKTPGRNDARESRAAALTIVSRFTFRRRRAFGYATIEMPVN